MEDYEGERATAGRRPEGQLFEAIVADSRPIRLQNGTLTVFARTALQDIADSPTEHFTGIVFEHFNMQPPIGRWVEGEVRDTEDGVAQAILRGTSLPQFVATQDVQDPFVESLGLIAKGEHVENDDAAPIQVDLSLVLEPRNFENAAWDELVKSSPLPVGKINKWSALPPLEWIIAVPVTVGSAMFAKAFAEELGKQTASTLVAWLKSMSTRVKEAGRAQYVTVNFALPGGRHLYGFIPFKPNSRRSIDGLQAGIASSDTLAAVAAAQYEEQGDGAQWIAYLFDGKEWRLAWFATNDAVYRTKYFQENMPVMAPYLAEPSLQGE